MSKKIMLKAEGALLRHQGTLADSSTKLALFIGELTGDQAVDLNELIKGKAVDVILLESGMLKSITEVLNQAMTLLDKRDVIDNSSDIGQLGVFDDE
jgi:hypothetical protein